MYKLSIIEPFDFGTVNNIQQFVIRIKKGINNNWLIILENPISYNEIRSKYLLSRTSKEYYHVDLQESYLETLTLEMMIIAGLNEENFTEYNIENYRGNFLTGELSRN